MIFIRNFFGIYKKIYVLVVYTEKIYNFMRFFVLPCIFTGNRFNFDIIHKFIYNIRIYNSRRQNGLMISNQRGVSAALI